MSQARLVMEFGRSPEIVGKPQSLPGWQESIVWTLCDLLFDLNSFAVEKHVMNQTVVTAPRGVTQIFIHGMREIILLCPFAGAFEWTVAVVVSRATVFSIK